MKIEPPSRVIYQSLNGAASSAYSQEPCEVIGGRGRSLRSLMVVSLRSGLTPATTYKQSKSHVE